jgi:ATP-dependent DNA ligase
VEGKCWGFQPKRIYALPDVGMYGILIHTGTSGSEGTLVLSRVHWVRPELVAEVTFLTWTDDNLLRHVVYEGLHEDKPAAEVRRPVLHPEPAAQTSTLVRSRRERS